MRNLLARVPKHAQPMVAALVRTIFAQPDLASAREQLEHVAANLDRRFPQAAALLRDEPPRFSRRPAYLSGTGSGSVAFRRQ